MFLVVRVPQDPIHCVRCFCHSGEGKTTNNDDNYYNNNKFAIHRVHACMHFGGNLCAHAGTILETLGVGRGLFLIFYWGFQMEEAVNGGGGAKKKWVRSEVKQRKKGGRVEDGCAA